MPNPSAFPAPVSPGKKDLPRTATNFFESGTVPPRKEGPFLQEKSATSAPVTVPGYEILGELGRGGMGVVYKARQVKLNRFVALKMVLAGSHASPQQMARFRAEAEAIARLQHPNIVQIHEVGEQNGLPYFSMELVPGQNLADRIATKPLSLAKAVQLVEVLGRAVHVAHKAGIVHRDLKPANILMTRDGSPKITDFGLAKQMDGSAVKTQSGAIMGTPAYMAPEQAEGKSKAIGPATDTYALGAILYELITGRTPFQGPTPLDIILQVLSMEPAPPSHFDPEISLDLDTICLKCLHKDPNKRYAKAVDLADDLRRCRADEPIRARPISSMERLGRWYQRHARTVLLTAALVLCLLGGCFFANKSRRAEVEASNAKEDARSAKKALELEKRRAEKTEDALAAFKLEKGAVKELEAPAAATEKEIINSLGMKLVRIPPGKFLMGSPKGEKDRSEDEVQHEVEISPSFYLGACKVTQEEYEKIMGTNPSYFSDRGEGKARVADMNTRRFPVETVSWEDANEFCRKLDEQDTKKPRGYSYRLPTEAEWEYSCRGGATNQVFHFGDSLSSNQANFNGNFPYGNASMGKYLERTREVGAYQPNQFGLYDMHGNVWEWCEDWYDKGYYKVSPKADPPGPPNGSSRVIRGGGWRYAGQNCRSAERHGFEPGRRDYGLGFRLALVPSSSASRSAVKNGKENPVSKSERFRKNPDQYLTGTKWQFYCPDERFICQLILERGGIIGNSPHLNETRWKVIGERIVFSHADGFETSWFSLFGEEDNHLEFRGPFRFNGWTVKLREVVE